MLEIHNSDSVYISPSELVVHPKLIEIYGENENRPALEKSISEKGILESLKVSARTGVNVILAGKCRLQVARQLGFSLVKVEFVESSSPEEDLKLVLDFNLHREGGKTHYQKFHEAQYWESVLRPLAKERQRESARRLNKSKCSNLNTSLDESSFQLKKGKPVTQEVSENLKISVGSYHKGKKVFDLISQLRELEKFKAAVALEGELNRSIDGAYKFVCDEDICNQVINLIEADSCCGVGDGIAWVRSGNRNPFRGFDVGQVYVFKKKLRPELNVAGRVIKITNEFVVFGFRNLVTMALEIVNLRPRQIDADLQDEPSMEQRERIFRLMQEFSDYYPICMSLSEMLKFPYLTWKEEAILRMLESGILQDKTDEVKQELEAMETSTNENRDNIRAA